MALPPANREDASIAQSRIIRWLLKKHAVRQAKLARSSR
jgi:hypothetical protein